MTTHVRAKHGLVLAKDNLFCHFAHGQPNHFEAIVWAKQLVFERISSLNMDVRSPAQQLLYAERRVPFPETGEDARFPRHRRIVEPARATQWLLKDIEGWSFAPPEPDGEKTPSFFFEKKADAHLFLDRALAALEGMDFL